MERREIMKDHGKAMLLSAVAIVVCVIVFMWWKGDIISGKGEAVTMKSQPKQWTLYGSDTDGAHYYRASDNPEPSPGIVRVWTQVVYNEEGRKRYADKRGTYKFATAGYEDFSHRNVLYEINCFSKKKEICIQEVYELTKDGKSLDYARAGTYKDWSDIPEGSVYETLYKTVCPEKRD
jgi:hypothetical protein